MSDKPPITIFDMQTLPLLFQIIKAMIPFLDFPMAKMLSVIIRLNELNYTINYFRSPDCADFISCNSSIPHIHSISDLLENDDFICAILPYCPPEYAGLIKNFKLFSNMSSMFNSDTDSLKISCLCLMLPIQPRTAVLISILIPAPIVKTAAGHHNLVLLWILHSRNYMTNI